MEQVEIKTHIGRVRAEQLSQLEEVCMLLKWSPERYCWHQYEMYERFIWAICKDMPFLRKGMRHSAVFRGFWNDAWAKRNEVDFFPFAYESSYILSEMVAEYEFINNYERLLNDESFMRQYDEILRLI